MAKPKPSKYITSFDLFMALLEREEGGFQMMEADNGNYNSKGQLVGTNRGISARFYEGIIGRPPTKADMEAITKEKATEIYREHFWDKTKAGKINSQAVANVLVDHEVNSGAGVKVMQKLLKNKFGVDIDVDGVMGPETLEAINSIDPEKLTNSFVEGRIAHYERLNQPEFVNQWKARAKRFKYKSNEDYRKISPNDPPEVVEAKKTAIAADQKLEELIKEDERISNLDEDDLPRGVTKEGMRSRVYQEVANHGIYDGFNEYIEESNSSKSEQYEKHQRLLKAFEGAEVDRYDKDGRKKSIYKDIKTGWMTEEEAEQVKADFPELGEYMHIRKEGNRARIIVNQKSRQGNRDNNTIPEFSKKFDKVNRDFFGEDYTGANLTQWEKDEHMSGGDVVGHFFTNVKDMFSETVLRKGGFDPGGIPEATAQKVANERPLIDKEHFTPQPKAPSKEEIEIGEVKSKSRGVEAGKAEKPKEEESTAAEDWLNTEAGLLGSNGQQMNYDKSKFRKELPLDAITGMALGLIGNEQAKNADIPLRTEEVSEAVKNYTADLAKKSKEGLPIEIEAAMRNQLAEVYQGGLQNIINASGGNRATVLGNQATLENARAKGLVEMQMADYEAKEKAFQQYGEAIKYINEFDARRDISNTQLRQQQGLLKQQEGKQLATAGFKQLTDSIRYQKENGPGSANHMYKSALMQRIFGFNPLMKDDGTGNTVGTKSWYEKNRDKEMQEKGIIKNYIDKMDGLSPEKRQLANKYWEKNGKIQGYKFIDYLTKNPHLEADQIDIANIDLSQAPPVGSDQPQSNEGLIADPVKQQLQEPETKQDTKRLQIPALSQGLLGQAGKPPEVQNTPKPQINQLDIPVLGQGLLGTPGKAEPVTTEDENRLAGLEAMNQTMYDYYENQ